MIRKWEEVEEGDKEREEMYNCIQMVNNIHVQGDNTLTHKHKICGKQKKNECKSVQIWIHIVAIWNIYSNFIYLYTHWHTHTHTLVYVIIIISQWIVYFCFVFYHSLASRQRRMYEIRKFLQLSISSTTQFINRNFEVEQEQNRIKSKILWINGIWISVVHPLRLNEIFISFELLLNRYLEIWLLRFLLDLFV